VVLEVGKEVQVDLTGQPGAQEQTITVTESMPLVETTNATLGGTLNNAQNPGPPLEWPQTIRVWFLCAPV